jgi:hypothetical protein
MGFNHFPPPADIPITNLVPVDIAFYLPDGIAIAKQPGSRSVGATKISRDLPGTRNGKVAGSGAVRPSWRNL